MREERELRERKHTSVYEFVSKGSPGGLEPFRFLPRLGPLTVPLVGPFLFLFAAGYESAKARRVRGDPVPQQERLDFGSSGGEERRVPSAELARTREADHEQSEVPLHGASRARL